ncbi:glycosyltransferase family protein [Thalassotalea atypica]|uniref:glycosyltransferase family protein n=1 Tax=Thalassotalea atypica TaxID=2054316 RepID=UPI0025733DAC|nr:glycosyltransferase family protein [Thalassotalea atypica]
MPKLFIIIQARMTSTRLPGKILLPLRNTTVLGTMIERLELLKSHIIIATTNDGSEAPIVDFCNEHDVSYFRGDTENVLSRYYLAAKEFGGQAGDIIVRLTSDCPLIDSDVVNNVISLFKKGNCDIAAASSNCGFPRGLDTEVFSFDLLETAFNNATEDYEKEHVTPYIYLTNKDKYRVAEFSSPVDMSSYRITLDEPSDYEVIKGMYEILGNTTKFTYLELVDALDKHPEISKLNQHIEQKKVTHG